jgi:acetyltransferase-like isoleucine patch superfamily enzyme
MAGAFPSFFRSDDYSGSAMTNPTVPPEFTHVSQAPVVLGRHVIIGSGSIVLPGSCLGDGVSIGALSLVKESLDPWGIYAGIPVKRLRDRSKELLELELRYLSLDP